MQAAPYFAILAVAGWLIAAAPDSRSAPLARRLATVLAEQHLDAIAAADPTTPDRFIGALIFPDIQLLVVAGQYAAPDSLRAQIAQRHYKDVYLALTGGSTPSTRVFFQDLKADGLHAIAGSGVDIMYEHVDKQTVFDGKPDAARFAAADEEYSRLLSLLVTQASTGPSSAAIGERIRPEPAIGTCSGDRDSQMASARLGGNGAVGTRVAPTRVGRRDRVVAALFHGVADAQVIDELAIFQ
jgi:hypothetical protein